MIFFERTSYKSRTWVALFSIFLAGFCLLLSNFIDNLLLSAIDEIVDFPDYINGPSL